VSGFPTRAALLTERAERVTDLEHRRHGWRRDVVPAAMMGVATFVALGSVVALEDDPAHGTVAVWCVVAAVVTVGLLVVLLRRVRASRTIDAELRRWAQLDRTRDARALPAGDVPAGLMTAFDARDRDDLADIASGQGGQDLGRVYDTRALVWPGLRAVVPFVVGVVLVLSGAFSGSGLVAGVPITVVGLVLLVAGGTTIWTSWVEAYRRQQGVNGGYEHTLYAARAAALGRSAPSTPQAVPLAARVVVAVIGVALVVLLVVRVARASTAAVLVAAAVLAVAGLLATVPLVRRRRLHVVPQTSGGPTVLDAPGRPPVTVELDGERLVVRDLSGAMAPAEVPLGAVLAVVDVRLGYPFAPPAVGIVTADENVVVAGSKVRSLPAIAAARDRAASRRV
jgi:hypothetical protein